MVIFLTIVNALLSIAWLKNENMKKEENNPIQDRDTNKGISSEAIEKIKNSLQKRKKQILEDLRDISNKKGNKFKAKIPEYGDKDDENAQEINSYSTNLATESILVKTLHDIEKTLKSMEEDTYGKCKYCGKKIDEKRLIARPTAGSCVDCKRKLQNY